MTYGKPPISQRALTALYTHGPCGVGTLTTLIGEKDSGDVASALRPLMNNEIMTKTVRLPGQPDAVDLFYLRGNGVG